MKLFVVFVLFILSLGASSHGHTACVFNTDDTEVFNLINFEDNNRVWEYLSKNPDCKIHKMFLGTYSKFKETEVLLFNYQKDSGYHPGIINSSVAICKKDLSSGLIICSRDQ
jgi:hypothetical protein